MKPFVLRRLKRDVLKDLPKKSDETIVVPMVPTQDEHYTKLVASYQTENGYTNGGITGLGMMMEMRKLSNHPLLMRQHYDQSVLPTIASRLAADLFYKENNKDYVLDDLTFMSDYQIHQLTQEYKVKYMQNLLK